MMQRFFVGAALCAALVGCGGAQQRGDGARGGNGGECGAFSATMSSPQLASTARCYAALETAEGAAACRDGIDAAANADAAGVGVLADCVLQAGDRADGTWLADLLATVADDQARLTAAANAIGRHFDSAVHGVAFASSIDPATQRALGPLLPSLDQAARDKLVPLVLVYRVAPLLEYCGPLVTSLDPTDPGVVAYAEHMATSEAPVDPAAVWALVATGTWTVDDVVLCHRGDRPGCAADGDNGYMLAGLMDSVSTVRDAATPNRALRLIRSGELTPDSVRGLAYAVTYADYPNRTTIVNALLGDMTDTTVSVDQRRAIATAGTAALCDIDMVYEFLLRARTSDPDRFTDATTPWAVYVTTCAASQWSPMQKLRALMLGSWLGVPEATYAALVDEVRSAADALSCADVGAEATQARDERPWVVTRHLAFPIAEHVTGARCRGQLAGDVDAVVSNSQAHAEARLLAIELQAGRGSTAGCRSIDEALRWRHEDYGDDAGPYAADRAAAARAACR